MKGLILNNAYYETPSTRYQSQRLKEEFAKLDVEVDVKRNNLFGAEIVSGELKSFAGEYDFCVYLDKDKYCSYALEKAGLRLFNSHQAIQVCDDKAVTFLALAGKGVPMPDTIPGLLCYDRNAKVDCKTVDYIESRLGYPLILKECFGSLGKFVFKVDTRRELEEACERVKCRPHLFQKFVTESAGRDVRVICIGGRAVCAMVRQSAVDFRSNIELGGAGTPIEIDCALRKLTEKVARLLKLDYCGIDVLFGKEGYLLCEVNSNAFFGGIERVTDYNVAKTYAEYILNCVI